MQEEHITASCGACGNETFEHKENAMSKNTTEIDTTPRQQVPHERVVISPNLSRHRKRWLDRINSAEKKARHIENEVHLVLDDIDEGKADLEYVRKMLLRAVQYAEGL